MRANCSVLVKRGLESRLNLSVMRWHLSVLGKFTSMAYGNMKGCSQNLDGELSVRERWKSLGLEWEKGDGLKVLQLRFVASLKAKARTAIGWGECGMDGIFQISRLRYQLGEHHIEDCTNCSPHRTWNCRMNTNLWPPPISGMSCFLNIHSNRYIRKCYCVHYLRPYSANSIRLTACCVTHIPCLMTRLWKWARCHSDPFMLQFQTKFLPKQFIRNRSIISATTPFKHSKTKTDKHTSTENPSDEIHIPPAVASWHPKCNQQNLRSPLKPGRLLKGAFVKQKLTQTTV